jgi:tripartite-type tricarboxylate transporter receptor subunit TctC
MAMNRYSKAVAFVAFVVPMLIGYDAWSQTTGTVKLIVPFPAGASSDILARLLSEQIAAERGATLVTENRPGAASLVGTEAASRATPDGNTLLLSSNLLIVTPHLRKVNYDPLTSFEPICQLVNSPLFIVVNSASPYRTLADFLDAARARPGNLTLAGTGPASPTQIALEMLKREAEVNLTFVPFPGQAPALTALLGQHVTSAIADYASVAEHLKAGTLRALATTSRTRIEALPDVPSVAESGYKSYEVNLWLGVFAPAKTPRDIAAKLRGWFKAAMSAAGVRERLATLGLYAAGICGADFGVLLRNQYEENGRIIRQANIKAE